MLSTPIGCPLAASLPEEKVERRNSMEWITRAEFLRMGTRAGLSERLVNSEINKLLKRLDKELDSFTQMMQEQYASPIYAEIQAGIRRRMRQLAE